MASRARRAKRQKCNSRGSNGPTTSIEAPIDSTSIDVDDNDDGVSNDNQSFETMHGENKDSNVIHDTKKDEEAEIKLRKSIQAIGQDFICACCMDIMINATAVVPCGHTFCNECLFRSIDEDTYVKDQCPTCRADIVATVLNRSVVNAIRSMIAVQEEQLLAIEQQQQKESPPSKPKRGARNSTSSASPIAGTASSSLPKPATTTTNTASTSTVITKQPVASFFLPDDVKSFRSRELSAPRERKLMCTRNGAPRDSDDDDDDSDEDDSDDSNADGGENNNNDPSNRNDRMLREVIRSGWLARAAGLTTPSRISHDGPIFSLPTSQLTGLRVAARSRTIPYNFRNDLRHSPDSESSPPRTRFRHAYISARPGRRIQEDDNSVSPTTRARAPRISRRPASSEQEYRRRSLQTATTSTATVNTADRSDRVLRSAALPSRRLRQRPS